MTSLHPKQTLVVAAAAAAEAETSNALLRVGIDARSKDLKAAVGVLTNESRAAVLRAGLDAYNMEKKTCMTGLVADDLMASCEYCGGDGGGVPFGSRCEVSNMYHMELL